MAVDLDSERHIKSFPFLEDADSEARRKSWNQREIEDGVSHGYERPLLEALQCWDYLHIYISLGRLGIQIMNPLRNNRTQLRYDKKSGIVAVTQENWTPQGWRSTGRASGVGVERLTIERVDIGKWETLFARQEEDALIGVSDLGEHLFKVGVSKTGALTSFFEAKPKTESP